MSCWFCLLHSVSFHDLPFFIESQEPGPTWLLLSVEHRWVDYIIVFKNRFLKFAFWCKKFLQEKEKTLQNNTKLFLERGCSIWFWTQGCSDLVVKILYYFWIYLQEHLQIVLVFLFRLTWFDLLSLRMVPLLYLHVVVFFLSPSEDSMPNICRVVCMLKLLLLDQLTAWLITILCPIVLLVWGYKELPFSGLFLFSTVGDRGWWLWRGFTMLPSDMWSLSGGSPLLYVIQHLYVPLAQLVQRTGLGYHQYTDDTQL